MKSLLSLTAAIYFLCSCSSTQNNATTYTSTRQYPKILEQARKESRFIIMYAGLDTFAVSSLVVENNKKEFTVHLDKLDSLHRSTMKNEASTTEPQVHLFVQDSASYTLDEPHTIPFIKLTRVEKIH